MPFDYTPSKLFTSTVETKLCLGASYRWGAGQSGNSTIIAGFFIDTEREARTVALTITPPPAHRSRNSNNVEILKNLICLVPLDNDRIDRSIDHQEIFEEIGPEEIPFGANCSILVKDSSSRHPTMHSASLIGKNRAVSLDGSFCRGLYEIETSISVSSMAGAPLIWQKKICGILVGDDGIHASGKSHAFVFPVHLLYNRLIPLPYTLEADRSDSDKFQTVCMPEFMSLEPTQLEAA